MKKSTKLWIVGIVAAVVVVAVLVGVKVKKKSKPNPNPDTNEKTEKDIGDDIESDKPYEGDGLTVGEKEDSTTQIIDLPDTWEENTNPENSGKQETTDSTDKTDKTDTSDSTDSDVSKGDILEGESWTKPR